MQFLQHMEVRYEGQQMHISEMHAFLSTLKIWPKQSI